MNTPTKGGMVKTVRIDDDAHARLVKRGRYDKTMSDIIRELLDMADKLEDAYNHKVPKLRVEETHVSWVILTGIYAYKIR